MNHKTFAVFQTLHFNVSVPFAVCQYIPLLQRMKNIKKTIKS